MYVDHYPLSTSAVEGDGLSTLHSDRLNPCR